MATFKKISLKRASNCFDERLCIHCGQPDLKEGHYQTVLNLGLIGPFCSVRCQITHMVEKKPLSTFCLKQDTSKSMKKTMKIPVICPESFNRAIKRTKANTKVVRRRHRVNTRTLAKHTILEIEND